MQSEPEEQALKKRGGRKRVKTITYTTVQRNKIAPPKAPAVVPVAPAPYVAPSPVYVSPVYVAPSPVYVPILPQVSYRSPVAPPVTVSVPVCPEKTHHVKVSHFA